MTWTHPMFSPAEAAVLAQSFSTEQPEFPRADLTRLTCLPVESSGIGPRNRLRVRIQRTQSEVSLTVSSRLPVRSNMRSVVDQMAEILALEEGWNSHSARPVHTENARAAILLLDEILPGAAPAPAVVPRVRGGVQLDWSTNGIDLEVYVDSPSSIRFFAEDLETGEAIESPVDDLTLPVLGKWLNRLSL